MAVKYVKDFDFPASAGFHSAPKHYAKGGAVKAPASTMKREMTKSNKLSGNTALPKIPDMDVYKQSGGAGTKLMPGYKKGGKVKPAEEKGVKKVARVVKPVTVTREIESVTTPAVVKPPMPRGMMKHGGKAEKRNMGGAMMAPQGVANARIPVNPGVQRNPRADEAIAKGALARAANMPVQRRASGGAMMSAQGAANAKVPTNPGAQRYEKANPKASFMKHGGKAKYAEGGKAPMSDRDAALAKRGIDPYEDRTRGLGPMTDKEAEEASKELRQKYGKKDESVKHPGGRQRFLSNQSEKTPMKKGGKAEASKSDIQQDRAMMARHNRLMHPGQKSKLAKGGVPSYNSKPMVKKAGGGSCNY